MFGLSKILSTMKLSPMLSGVINGMVAPQDPRTQFCAVLLATVDHVNQKPNFNLELEINDLWTRLGNLRQQPQAGGLFTGIMAGLSQTNGLSQSLTKSMEALLKNTK